MPLLNQCHLTYKTKHGCYCRRYKVVQSKREEQTTCELIVMSTSESQTWMQNHPYIKTVFKDRTSATKQLESFLLTDLKTENHKILREVLVKFTVAYSVTPSFNHV